jgi:AraC-like DNA-binding protein
VTADPADEMMPLQRVELVTQDMDLIAELIRDLHARHEATFSCPDPALVDGRVRSVTVGGLTASLIRYGGFTYFAKVEPVDSPAAVVCTGNSGIIATAREDLRLVRGDVFMSPADLPFTTAVDAGDYATLRVPWAAMGSAAEAVTGAPAADLRFWAMAPVSADRQRMFARTAELICGQLVTSGATGIHPLVVQELTRQATDAFLATFPNTTMTALYLPGPGWVAPSAARRAAAFLEAHADEPVTLDEIAAAAGVTGRALQYAFRRYFGTTPIGYLRRIRLERAHAELGDADPAGGITVAAVARRWGWASHSRFTVAYQKRFGVLPSHTLRA